MVAKKMKKSQMLNLKKTGAIRKVTPKKQKVKYLIINNICTKLYMFFFF